MTALITLLLITIIAAISCIWIVDTLELPRPWNVIARVLVVLIVCLIMLRHLTIGP